VDKKLVQSFKNQGNIKIMTLEADEKEHSLELHLPFIRKVLDDIPILPIMVG
jgi:MEMO1 family protein